MGETMSCAFFVSLGFLLGAVCGIGALLGFVWLMAGVNNALGSTQDSVGERSE